MIKCECKKERAHENVHIFLHQGAHNFPPYHIILVRQLDSSDCRISFILLLHYSSRIYVELCHILASRHDSMCYNIIMSLLASVSLFGSVKCKVLCAEQENIYRISEIICCHDLSNND